MRENRELTYRHGDSFFGAFGLSEAARGIIGGAVEEMIDSAEHVMLRKHLKFETRPRLAAQTIPKVVFRQADGPERFASEALPGGNGARQSRNIAAQYLLRCASYALPKLMIWSFAERSEMRRLVSTMQKFACQLPRM